jgi:uncharacterized protein (TIGR02145 family)
MTNIQMNAIIGPEPGLIVHCLDCDPAGIYAYNGTSFVSLTVGSTPPSKTGSEFTIPGANDQAFSTNGICSDKRISYTACTANELLWGIDEDTDGYYSVVEIGDPTSGYKQCWMAENMQAGPGFSPQWQDNTDNGWYGYYDDGDVTPDTQPSGYNEKEGFLYQWSAAMAGDTAERSQGICPTGWHIPSDCEWMFLENNIGMSITDQENNQAWRGTNEGTKLKQEGSSDFEGILAGFRYDNGWFDFRGNHVGYWSSSSSGSNAYIRNLDVTNPGVFRNTISNKAYAWSVRCLKD